MPEHSSGKAISDLRAIATLFNLHRLDLAHTTVMKVAPPGALPRLEVLQLEGTHVPDLAMLSLIETMIVQERFLG